MSHCQAFLHYATRRTYIVYIVVTKSLTPIPLSPRRHLWTITKFLKFVVALAKMNLFQPHYLGGSQNYEFLFCNKRIEDFNAWKTTIFYKHVKMKTKKNGYDVIKRCDDVIKRGA